MNCGFNVRFVKYIDIRMLFVGMSLLFEGRVIGGCTFVAVNKADGEQEWLPYPYVNRVRHAQAGGGSLKSQLIEKRRPAIPSASAGEKK